MAFNAFNNGVSIGKTEKSALTLGQEAHDEWLTLENDDTFKIDWCAGYITSVFGLTEKQARAWADMTRTERTAIEVVHVKGNGTAELVWNASTKAYDYRVVKNSGRVAAANSTPADVKLTKKQRDAIKACAAAGVDMKLYGQGIKIMGIKVTK